MVRYERSHLGQWFSQLLVVVSSVWFAPASSADSTPDCNENTRVIDATMPELSEDQRAIIVHAIGLDSHEPYPSCSFELDAILDYIPSRVERYDAQSESETKWTLITIEDREPRERERNKTPRYTRMTPGEAWNDLRENVDWDSLNVEKEDAELVSFVGLKDLKVGEDEFVTGSVTLEIDKATRTLRTVTISMNEPHKINFFASIAAMTMVQNYRYEQDISHVMLDQLTVDWKFKFVFAPASSTEQISYSDYDCQPARPIQACSE